MSSEQENKTLILKKNQVLKIKAENWFSDLMFMMSSDKIVEIAGIPQ